LVKVEKRSGELEEFDMPKLESSLTKAGVSDEDATRIAETVARNLTDGTHTAELMMLVASELRRIDPAAALKYTAFKSARVPR
jgi:transcriptional regulator NrdR family protein